MIPGGYILSPRVIDTSDAAKLPPICRELFQYLCRKVNHADVDQYKRGSGFFQFQDIQDDLSWWVGYRQEKYSKPRITKALRRLREESMVATAKATRGIYITVLNYEVYQDPSNYEGNDEGSTKATRRKRGGHTKNKNEEECKNVKKKTNGAFRPPSKTEVQVYCLERQNGIDAEEFIDHYEANGWMRGKSKIKSWQACIRTWEKNRKKEATATYAAPLGKQL